MVTALDSAQFVWQYCRNDLCREYMRTGVRQRVARIDPRLLTPVIELKCPACKQIDRYPA